MRNKRLWFHVSSNAHIEPGIQIFARNHNSNLDPWLSISEWARTCCYQWSHRRTHARRRRYVSICRASGLSMMVAELYFRARRALRWSSDAVIAATFAITAKRSEMIFIFEYRWITTLNRIDSQLFIYDFRSLIHEWRYRGLRLFKHWVKHLCHLEKSILQTFRGARTVYGVNFTPLHPGIQISLKIRLWSEAKAKNFSIKIAKRKYFSLVRSEAMRKYYRNCEKMRWRADPFTILRRSALCTSNYCCLRSFLLMRAFSRCSTFISRICLSVSRLNFSIFEPGHSSEPVWKL
jgi:hypothetical protein